MTDTLSDPSSSREWPNGLRALSSRDYRVFWCAALVSSVGSQMQLAALGWVIAVLTGSATKVSLVAFATIIPLVVLSPVAGSLTDRYPRRHLLLVTMAIQTAQATALVHRVVRRNPRRSGSSSCSRSSVARRRA